MHVPRHPWSEFLTTQYKTNKQFCQWKFESKSTGLLQTQRVIESWSISTALVRYSLRSSQVYWYYNNNIPYKKRKEEKKKTLLLLFTTAKQTNTATTYKSPCFTMQVEMLSGNRSEWSKCRVYIPYPTITIVKWCHTLMETVHQHQKSGS